MTRSRKPRKVVSAPPKSATAKKAPSPLTDINYINHLKPYSELVKFSGNGFWIKQAYLHEYGLSLGMQKLSELNMRDGCMPLTIARRLFAKIYPNLFQHLSGIKSFMIIPSNLRLPASCPPSAKLVNANEVPFSFKAVCDLVAEGLDYQISLLQTWSDSSTLLGQTVADALENMEQLHWPKHLRPTQFGFPSLGKAWDEKMHADEYTMLVSDGYLGLVFWLEMDACIQRIKALGMPDSDTEAFKAIRKAGSIREEYLSLVRVLQDLTCISFHALFLAWAQGRGSRYISWGSSTAPFSTWATIQPDLRCKESIWTITGKDSFEGALAGFALLADTGAQSLIPREQTWLFLEMAMKNQPEKTASLSRHMTYHLNRCISVNNLEWTMMRAFGTDDPARNMDEVIRVQPQSTWPTTFKERYGKYKEMMAYVPQAMIGAPPMTIVYGVGDDGEYLPLSGSGDTFKHIYKGLNKKFGRLDKYFIPAEILERQPYWHLDPPRIHPPPVAAETSSSIHPISETSFVQSGHAYRKEIGITPLRSISDTDTDSIAQRFDSLDIANASSDVVPTAQGPQKRFKVNSQLYNTALHLLGTVKDATAGQMRWEHIVNFMKHIGFKVQGTGGSMNRFVPPDNAGRFFVEHAPHPEPAFDRIRYRAFGKRLQKLYGWTIDWFVTCSENQNEKGESQ